MINEHDIKHMHEENKDKQPEPKPEVKPELPAVELQLLIECNNQEAVDILLSTIPFGR